LIFELSLILKLLKDNFNKPFFFGILPLDKIKFKKHET
jgi:hypothetical protein